MIKLYKIIQFEKIIGYIKQSNDSFSIEFDDITPNIHGVLSFPECLEIIEQSFPNAKVELA